VRDLFILLMLLFLFGAACKRPFLMTLAYLYVDLVQPQQISYYLVNSVPVSMIFGAAAVLFFLMFDDKRNLRFGRLQVMMILFLVWITFTTFNAQLGEQAWIKWDPAWKAIIFGVFLPFVLRTRQRVEAAVMFMLVCIGSITITGGFKTLLGGGGYGTMSLLVDSNNGLYEGSTISAVAVALIPLILYVYNYNQIFPKQRITLLIAAGLIFAAALIPIGTEARTGLICLAMLGFLLFLRSKRKLLFGAVAAVLAVAAIPLLPDSFTGRMSTIKSYEEDNSASTRVAVWNWTLDFVKDHPFGGGFYAYKLNRIEVKLTQKVGTGSNSREETRTVFDQARAFHSSYFEVLGEHGYPGILIYLSMLVMALLQLRGIAKRFKTSDSDAWLSHLATALGQCMIIYMAGSLFVGIAFQSMLYYLLALAASLGHIAAIRTQSALPGVAHAAAGRPALATSAAPARR